jgi:hypothetical protein
MVLAYFKKWMILQFWIVRAFFLFIFIMSLQSCENDIKSVNQLTIIDSLPVETVRDIEVIQSDSGKITFKLTSPELNRYEGPDPYMEFPRGFKIVFFDSAMQIKSQLTGNYGVSYEKRKIMEAKNNVEVINYQRNQKLIYSNVFVKVTSPDRTIFGENGLEADERFDSWKLKKAKGEIIVDQDKY